MLSLLRGITSKVSGRRFLKNLCVKYINIHIYIYTYMRNTVMHTRHKDYSNTHKKHNTTDKQNIPTQPHAQVTAMTESDKKISKTDKQVMSDTEVGLMEEDEKVIEENKAASKVNKEPAGKKVDPNRNEDVVVREVKPAKKKVITLQDDDGKEIGTVELNKVRKKRKYVATLSRWTGGVVPTLLPLSALMHGMPTHIHTIYISETHKYYCKCKLHNFKRTSLDSIVTANNNFDKRYFSFNTSSS
jgi:hypothetical protein